MMNESTRSLPRCDLGKVTPRLRPLVIEAWARGEEVPEAVTLIGDREPTEAEREYGESLEPLACSLTAASLQRANEISRDVAFTGSIQGTEDLWQQYTKEVEAGFVRLEKKFRKAKLLK